MARLYPFRALRYDTSRVPMSEVVTQPYDKISPDMQERYYKQSPYNLIRVILGKRDAQDTEENNVYTRAAGTLKAWRGEGILREESEPALYGYSQTYTVPGTEEVRERRGFIALGHLYDYADHVVFRHEQTFPKHKSDRLALFKATRTYCEQIYMLYSDRSFTAEKLIFGLRQSGPGKAESGAAPELEITDEYGVLHRLWKLTDPALIEQVLDAMADKQLIIADGHHRYETSVAYMHERAAELGLDTPAHPSSAPEHASPLSSAPEHAVRSGETRVFRKASAEGTSKPTLPEPDFPEQAMMMTFVNMEAPGITILPTHRVVFGFPDFNGREFAEQAEEFFIVEQMPNTADGPYPGAARLLVRLEKAPGTAFVAATREGDFLLTPRAEAIAPLLADLSPRQAALDVVQLHRIVLDRMLALNEGTVRAGSQVRYVREAADALQQVGHGDADIAFLIKPVTLDQMKDVSLNLEVMPQKSTDFYPKLLSGLAMYTLD